MSLSCLAKFCWLCWLCWLERCVREERRLPAGTAGRGPTGGGPAGPFVLCTLEMDLAAEPRLEAGVELCLGCSLYGPLRKSRSMYRSPSAGTLASGNGEAGVSFRAMPKLDSIISSVAAGDLCGRSYAPAASNVDIRCCRSSNVTVRLRLFPCFGAAALATDNDRPGNVNSAFLGASGFASGADGAGNKLYLIFGRPLAASVGESFLDESLWSLYRRYRPALEKQSLVVDVNAVRPIDASWILMSDPGNGSVTCGEMSLGEAEMGDGKDNAIL